MSECVHRLEDTACGLCGPTAVEELRAKLAAAEHIANDLRDQINRAIAERDRLQAERDDYAHQVESLKRQHRQVVDAALKRAEAAEREASESQAAPRARRRKSR